MTVGQVKDFYADKKVAKCKLTKKLIKSGYQQKNGGYIKTAKENGIPVDYTKAEPSQWWHLMESYCKNKNDSDIFHPSVRCGELLFWMAEMLLGSRYFDLNKKELKAIGKVALKIAKENTLNGDTQKPLRTVESNTYIREKLFYKIKDAVEKHSVASENA